MALTRWTVVEARGRFSELVERTLREGPQAVTRNGADAVVMVAARDFRPGVGKLSPLDVLSPPVRPFALHDDFLARTFPRLSPPPVRSAGEA
jgi:prevent-host-death family protein